LLLQRPARSRSRSLLAPSWLLADDRARNRATIIASQTVISGVFSVASYALNLGYLPRIRILQSSATAIGQIYVPAMGGCCSPARPFVVVFGSSEALAGAYGIAVSATMAGGGCCCSLRQQRGPPAGQTGAGRDQRHRSCVLLIQQPARVRRRLDSD
jgi:KUP system potassium uptake protein